MYNGKVWPHLVQVLTHMYVRKFTYISYLVPYMRPIVLVVILQGLQNLLKKSRPIGHG